jgi:indole-3-glycerol phosphate synthase
MPETQAEMRSGRHWSPPTGTLGDLVTKAYVRANALNHETDSLRARAESVPPAPSFAAALRRPDVALIAEVKRSSPSKGAINPHLDAVAQARTYADAGAAAISVLTEPDRFGGSVKDLADVAAAVSVPVLRKDFLVAPVQLYEARALGASAALLIARAVDPERLRELHEAGRSVGLELLVEVHTGDELDVALAIGARIIGVNNRNLETLHIDPLNATRIIPVVPRELVAIAESGMSCRDDVVRAAAVGADAVLVGSFVSASDDPAAAVEQLVGVPATGRDGRH